MGWKKISKFYAKIIQLSYTNNSTRRGVLLKT